MAVDTVSELFSAVYVGLGSPEDQYLDKKELSNILFRQLALRLESVRQSEQRIAIAASTQFTLGNSEDEKNLTTLEADFVIPLWVERQVVDINSRPVWQFVPTVNLSQLQARRAEASPAVSFYGGDSTEVIAKFSYYGSEVAQPSRYTQVWYSKTVPFPQYESDSLNLPDNLTQMVTLDCMFYALPLMITNASKYVVDIPSLAPLLAAWKDVMERSPKLPTFFLPIELPHPSQLSSITYRLFFLATFMTAGISTGFPTACTQIIALVFFEIAFSISLGSRL